MESTPNKKNKTKKVPDQDGIMTYRNFFIDIDGNKVIWKSTDKQIGLFLKLKSEKRRREVGHVTKSTRTLFIRRDRNKHLYYTLNAYGFNQFILKRAKHFDWIKLSDEKADYKIPRTYILENGQHLKFSDQKHGGFELQLFITLEQLEQFKIPKNSNTRF